MRRGEQSAIARELGCTRVWVGMTARELGVRVTLPERRACEPCGKTTGLSEKRGICGRCLRKAKLVTLKCANCGTSFQRSLYNHNRFLARPVTQRRRGPVCGRNRRVSCQTTCAWCGQVSTRPYRREKRLGFCGASRPCLSNAMRALSVAHWRHLTPELLPMKDHRGQIRRLRKSLRTTQFPGSLQFSPHRGER